MTNLARSAHRPGLWHLAALATGAFIASLVFSACSTNNDNPNTEDIVSSIPWQQQESHTYTLKDGNDTKGTAVLALTKQEDRYVLTQNFSDDKGNSDESSVEVDPSALKPMSSRREVIDKDTRSLAEASYEDVDKDCSSKRIVHVKQSVFKPATDDNPDSTRSSPLCVPAHSYDNDSSLFIWRTIKFEKGYTASYNTIIADRRLKQGVTLFVRDQTQIDTRDGKTDAWLVDIKADANTQQAWFATTPDHKLLRYNNGTLEFVLAD